MPRRALGEAQRGHDERSGVPASLWFSNDELAVEQFQALAGPEDAELDQALIFDACPAPDSRQGHDRGGHRFPSIASPHATRQRSITDTLLPAGQRA